MELKGSLQCSQKLTTCTHKYTPNLRMCSKTEEAQI